MSALEHGAAISENDSNDAPPPKQKELLKKIENNLLICPECQSEIQIIVINEETNMIEFKCIKNNHKIKISIKDYLNQIRDLKNKNANNDICEDNQHNLKYEYYCINCKKHLCKACLKSRNHINHFKYNLFEMQPNKNELNIIENIIKDYENKIEFLEKEKIKINKKYNEAKNKLNQRKELGMKKNKIDMEKEIKLKIDEYLLNLNNLGTQYENDIKLMKNKNKKNIDEIKKKYMKKNEYNNFYNDTKIEILDKEEISTYIIQTLYDKYPNLLKEKYGIETIDLNDLTNTFDVIGRRRGCLMKGNIVDYEKVYDVVINDLKEGKIGKVTFD